MVMEITQAEGNKVNGTSFHNSKIVATIDELTDLFGEAPFQGDRNEKVQYSWELTLSQELFGDIHFTIYDWKQYRTLSRHSEYEFHIGGFSKSQTERAREAVEELLMDYRGYDNLI